jgi:hypothetical protein
MTNSTLIIYGDAALRRTGFPGVGCAETMRPWVPTLGVCWMRSPTPGAHYESVRALQDWEGTE